MASAIALFRVLRFIWRHPLCAGRRGASLLRFLRWQFAARLLKQPVVVPFVNQTRLIAERGATCGPGNYYVGLFEFEEMAFTLHYLRPEDVFFDIGANIGTFTILAAGAVGARCLSFEPIPSTYQRLLDNVGLNRLHDRVSALNIGLGSKPGRLPFTAGVSSTNHVATHGDSQVLTLEAEITTLDQISRSWSAEVAKIDVEGYETEVILGGDRLLATGKGPNAILIELRGHGSRYGFCEEAVHKRFLKYGYRPFVYNPRKRILDDWRPKGTGKLGDMLYIRDIEKARKRVESARAFSVLGKML